VEADFRWVGEGIAIKKLAIKHTDEADRHIQRSLEEYIAAGEHLIEVKTLIPRGGWEKWVKEEYGRSPDWANRLRRLAENQDNLPDHVSRRGSVTEAMQLLGIRSSPKEEKPESSETTTPPEESETTSVEIVPAPQDEAVHDGCTSPERIAKYRAAA